MTRHALNAKAGHLGRLTLIVTGACGLAAGHVPTSRAADSETAAAAPPTDVLGEIIVTARKRAETVQHIPESIEAFNPAEIEDAHLSRIDDLGNLVSNLNINTGGDNTPAVVMRGVGTFSVVAGVGFYANDVQLFDGQAVRSDDIERIEVLKGPQGTLYGGSNIGGAIKYITKVPTDDFEAQASVEAGNYNTQTYSAIVSGPLVKGVLDARLSMFDSETTGYIYDTTLQKNVGGGPERGARATFVWKGEDTRATLYLNGDWTKSGIGANLYARPDDPSAYTYQIADGTEPSYVRGLYSATLNVEHQFPGDITLTSISSYFHSYASTTTDVDKGPLPFLTAFQTFRTVVGSEELRLSNSSDGPFKWLLGAFVQGYDPRLFTTSRSFNGDPSNPASLADPTQYSDQDTDTVQKHRTYAVFGNARYSLNRWTFEAGIRADYNNSSMEDPLYGLHDAQHGSQLSPKVSVSYDFAKDLMSYATISRGFEPGDLVEQFDAFNNPYISSYRAQTITNYELGLKSTFLERFRFNAAVFYIDYQERLFLNRQLQAGQFIQVIENIGPSHNYGGEFDISARLSSDWLISASAGLTKAVWGNVPYYDPDLNVEANLDGQSVPNAPEYQAALSVDWSHHLNDKILIGARLDESVVGRQYWDPTDHFYQTAYPLTNFGLRVEGDKWSIHAHVNNAFNRSYFTAYSSAAELGAPFNVGGIGRPRLYTVKLTYKF